MDASTADEEAGDSFGTPLPDLPFPITSDPGDSGPGAVAVDDAASAVDPSAAYSVTLTMSPFTVEPNHEVYKCQDFANPFGGQAVDIHRYDLDMNEGSHHMILFYNQGATDGNVVDCPNGGFQQGPNTFGAQTPKASQTYPDGVGAAIPVGTGFTVNAHYVNSGSTPIQAAVKVTMFVAKPGLTTHHDPADGAAVPGERHVRDPARHERDLRGQPHAPARHRVHRDDRRDDPLRDHRVVRPAVQGVLAAAGARGELERHVDVHVRERHGEPARLRPVGAVQRDVQLRRDVLPGRGPE
jgi:hypothetical protein